MLLRQIFDPELAQYAYLVGCQKTGEALLVDPERDIDRYIEIAKKEDLRISSVAETHIHADFLAGTREFAARDPEVQIYLSDEGPPEWKYTWALDSPYNVHYLEDGDTFFVGNIEITAIHTPGHTPEHMSFLVTDHGSGASLPIGLLSGDFVFVGDLGRPDLLEQAAGLEGTQEPAARALYESVQRFLQLRDHIQIWPAHGAGSACGKALGAVPTSTVGYERLYNASIKPAAEGVDPFVAAILDSQPEPPPYFARMKALNKEGADILGGVPEPPALSVDQLDLLTADGSTVLDTRADRSAFMRAHVPGSLYAPMGSALQTVAGSYIDPSSDIYLIAEKGDAHKAATSLMRIGYDRVVGYVTPETLANSSTATTEIPVTTFAEALPKIDDDSVVLDVRGAADFREGGVPGALNIAHTRLEERLDEVPRNKTVYVHCQTGRRAAFSAALLQREGFPVVYIDDDFEQAAAAQGSAA